MQDKNFDAIARTPASVDRRDMLRGTGAGALALGALATAGLAASASPAISNTLRPSTMCGR